MKVMSQKPQLHVHSNFVTVLANSLSFINGFTNNVPEGIYAMSNQFTKEGKRTLKTFPVHMQACKYLHRTNVRNLFF